jgi:hypothetical protein
MFIFCCCTFLVLLAKKYYLNCLSSTSTIVELRLTRKFTRFFPPYLKAKRFHFLTEGRDEGAG